MQGSILDHVGRTPLVPLRRLNLGLAPTICLKVESSNPGGSIKDRVAIAMIDVAEKQGWLRAGGTIIEATAGNTGVGLAMAAAVKGYRCIFVMPDKMSGEKIRLLSAYGAEIVITPTSVPPDSPDSYNGVADRLSREIPYAWRPNQFANLANPEVHYQMTGPEIWDQTGGKITAFVAGCGTGGTISGVGRFLKEKNPADQGHRRRPRGFHPFRRHTQVVEGRRDRRGLRAAYLEQPSRGRVDSRRRRRILPHGTRTGSQRGDPRGRLQRHGRRGGIRFARRLGPDDLVVALCPDTGRNYLSKFFDDRWLEDNRLSWDPQPTNSIGDLIRARGPRQLKTISPEATVTEAVELLQATGISQLPVLRDGLSVGSIQEVTLARTLHDRGDPEKVKVAEVMARPLPQLDVSHPARRGLPLVACR